MYVKKENRGFPFQLQTLSLWRIPATKKDFKMKSPYVDTDEA